MKKVLYTGICVCVFQIVCFVLFMLTNANAQTTYLSTFANPAGQYNSSGPSCSVGVNAPVINSPSSVATEILTDYATLSTPLANLSLLCSNNYTIRTKLNLSGQPSVPASTGNPYYAGFRIAVSSVGLITLLSGNGGSNFIIKTFQNGVQADEVTGVPIGLGLLQAGVPGNVYFQTTAPFNEVQIEVGTGALALGAIADINFYYAFASDNLIVLPVKLTDFTARFDGKSVQLAWQSAMEQSLAAYEVERSNGGSKYDAVTNIAAKGNANGASYSFTDNTVVSGKSFYRLKMIDKDGTASYSKVVAVKSETAPKWKVYPTLLSSGMDINAAVSGTAKKQLQLTNLQGQVVRSVSTTDNKIVIATGNLPSGVYLLKMISNGQLQGHEKIVVQ